MKNLFALMFLLVLSSCFEKKIDLKTSISHLQNTIFTSSSIKTLIKEDLIWPEVKTPLNVKMAFFQLDQKCLWGLLTKDDLTLGLSLMKDEGECRDHLAHDALWLISLKKNSAVRLVRDQMKYIQIKSNSEKAIDFKIELPSVATTSPLAFQRFDDGLKLRGIPSVLFTTDETLQSDQFKTYASSTAEFTTTRLNVCHQMNEFCEVIHEYDCEKCDQGWIEVFDHGCPGGGSKYCAREQCGRKNQPACLLGIDWVSPDIAKNCTIEDPRVFCSPGTTMYCDSDGVAICL